MTDHWLYTCLFFLQLLDVCSGGGLPLLLQYLVPLGHPPVVRAGHGWTVGPTCCRLHLLPVLPAGPGPDPGLGVHHQSPGPGDVLLTRGWQTAPLLSQLLRNGPDVVGQEPAAAPDVADTHVVGLPGKPMHLKPAQEIIIAMN